MKKKILVFHPALVPYRVDFFNSLNRVFISSFYFKFSNALTQEFDQDDLRKRCDFICYYLDNGIEILGKTFRRGILSKVRVTKPNIVLCSEYGPTTILLMFYSKFFNKTFKLYTISDDSVDGSIRRTGLRAYVRNIISKNIDGVIFNSEEVCHWHKKHVSEKINSFVLPIIHNDDILRNRFRKSIDKANQKIAFHLFTNKKVILFVGRLEKIKNVDFLIKCFLRINSDDSILVIVGDGLQRSNLNLIVNNEASSNKVIFTGRLEGEELYSWYLLATLFVLPSEYEPFGAVVNEALLAGCYVLCSENAGASSLINDENGTLFNPQLEMDLKVKIIQYLDKCQPIGAKIEQLRDSKMSFTFDDKINKLIEDISSAS